MCTLHIFSLRYDVEDPVLSHCVTWANSFSKHFDKVRVHPTHIGVLPKSIPRNLVIQEIGGGDFKSRFIGIVRIIKTLLYIIFNRKESKVFFHMTEKYAAIISPFLRLARVRSALWYSHPKNSVNLRLSSMFCDLLFSPTEQSFPRKNKKLRVYGHGIDVEKFTLTKSFEQRNATRILCLSRISRTKRIEVLIEAVGRLKLDSDVDISIDLFGPILDENYFRFLNDLSIKENVLLQYCGVAKPTTIAKLLNEYQMLFVGNPFTIDKVGVEATCCGTIVVTDVTTLGEHTGTFEAFLNYIDYRQNPSIETQIRLVMENQEFFKIASTKLALQGRSMNNLESLVNRIALELLAVKA